MKSFRNGKREAFMPSGAIEHEHDLFLLTRSHGLGEVLQGQRKEVGIDAWQKQPLGVS